MTGKNLLVVFLLLLPFGPVWNISVVGSTEIHVSPKGTDQNAGTLQAPVQTLEKARDLARSARRENPERSIEILLHPGIYRINKTVVFTREDSGTESAPLIISNWRDPKDPQARPHLVGGLVIDGWKKSDFNGRNDILVADLASYKISKKFHQLFLNGSRQIWARYPNWDPSLPYSGGWAYVDGVRPPMYTDIPGEPCDKVVLRQKDMRNWSRPTDGEVCIFPRYNWWNRIVRITGFDSASRTITLEKPMQYAARPEDRFAVFGMKEELDAPGEWYQDVDNQKLYFLPPKDLDGQIVTVPTVNEILLLREAKFIQLHGLEMSCAETASVRFANSENCVLEKSLIHDLGYFSGAGVDIQGGSNCAVRGCDIWNIGGHGVQAIGGNPVKMTKSGHQIDNCYIHHVGQFNRHGLGIMIGGAGVTASNNLIHDTPRCGIFHGGVLHTLEYNRIRHGNLEMEDTGLTYGGGWTGGWTRIRFNHVTDSIGFNNHGKFFVFAWGIYLDEAGCGCDVYGNIVERCQVGAMHLHNARWNRIFNNIFANNAGPAGQTHQISFQGWNNSPNGIFMTSRKAMYQPRWDELAKNPEWMRMRGFKQSPADPFLPDGNIMDGNRIERNIFYYPNQPDSAYISAHNVNLEHNIFNKNIIWSGGKPIKTGRTQFYSAGADLSDRLPNREFKPASEEAVKSNPNQTVADGWTWYHKTFPEMTSLLVKDQNGKPAFRYKAAFNDEQRYVKNSTVKSPLFDLKPGKDYLLSFDLKCEENDGPMLVRVVTENQGLWLAVGAEAFHAKSGKMTTFELPFHVPAPGEKNYDERIAAFTLQFQFLSKTGWAEISALALKESKNLDQWQSWQKEGGDKDSIVADPMFVDPEHGDFHLKKESPALKLGFIPIPIEKIGPYKADFRVTWPIQEAEGAREHPEWLTSVPINNAK